MKSSHLTFSHDVFTDMSCIRARPAMDILIDSSTFYNLPQGGCATALATTCVGANDVVSDSATFVGGATPTTYAGWELASGSPSYHAGLDGKSMGINP